MTGWDDDDDAIEAHTPTISIPPPPTLPTENDAELVEAKNPFIAAYMKSIKQARNIINGQWRECIWDKKNLNIEPPASPDEVSRPCYINARVININANTNVVVCHQCR